MRVCKLCQDDLPNWIMHEGKERNISNRKFCLKCSPFGSRNTRDLTVYKEPSVAAHCLQCGLELSEQTAYRKPQSTTLHPYCKRCFNVKSQERQRHIKQQCIEYKGDCCSRCGYNRCLSALEFHHTSDEKEREISGMKSRSFERLKSELDRCILVCANCHREIHAGYEAKQIS